MSFLAIFVALFLEYKNLFSKIKIWFKAKISQYAGLFINRDFQTVREIRICFILAILPFIAVTSLLIILPINDLDISYFLINCALFILCVDILGWREEAKQAAPGSNYQSFVQSFATNFFATTFWFVVFPSVLGAICYLTLTAMGNKLRARGEESVVYSMVVDKMLFWINIVPYTVLIFFIAIAGDFEEVMHYVLAQKGKVKASFFYLENLLNEVAFTAIGKDKFTNSTYYNEDYGIEDLRHKNNLFDPKVVDFVVALLYRAGLFFIGTIAIISIADLLNI